MAQFDVYENLDGNGNVTRLVVDVQTDLLNPLATRVAVPLVSEAHLTERLQNLNPLITLNRSTFVLSSAELTCMSVHKLGKLVGNVSAQREDILAAIQFLVAGI